MKKISLFCSIFAVLFAMTACSNDDDNNSSDYTFTNTQQISALDIRAYESMSANGGRPTLVGFTKVKLTANEAEVVTGDDWDIAFNSWDIYLNAGDDVTKNEKTLTKTGTAAYYIADGTLENILTVDASKFESKTDIEYDEWEVYNQTTHMLSPTAGKIIVLRTRDNQFAKLKIDSYYQGMADITAPDDPTTAYKLGYFSFTFIYN